MSGIIGAKNNFLSRRLSFATIAPIIEIAATAAYTILPIIRKTKNTTPIPTVSPER